MRRNSDYSGIHIVLWTGINLIKVSCTTLERPLPYEVGVKILISTYNDSLVTIKRTIRFFILILFFISLSLDRSTRSISSIVYVCRGLNASELNVKKLKSEMSPHFRYAYVIFGMKLIGILVKRENESLVLNYLRYFINCERILISNIIY